MYTTQTVFPPHRVGGANKILIVKTNGGSVAVEYEMDGQWMTAYTFSEDGAYDFNRRAQWRITPSGGAVYEIR